MINPLPQEASASTGAEDVKALESRSPLMGRLVQGRQRTQERLEPDHRQSGRWKSRWCRYPRAWLGSGQLQSPGHSTGSSGRQLEH